MRQKHRYIVLAVLFILALGLTIYPLVSNYVGEKSRSIIQSEYHEVVQEMDTSQIEERLEKACEYNALLTPGATEHAAFSREALVAAEEDYYELLNVNGKGIMGYLMIPKIDVSLPIYHGTTDDVLNHGLGHLLGSSLPIGGENTHSIITGHSGLAGQRMLSDLDQLKEGDIFYVQVLNKVLSYEVDAINTVLPEDTSKLGIDYMQDYCTLVTCTPYGVNTHRLLVRGHRVTHEEAIQLQEEIANENEEVISSWTDQYVLGLVIGGLFITVLIVILLHRYIRQEEYSYEDEE